MGWARIGWTRQQFSLLWRLQLAKEQAGTLVRACEADLGSVRERRQSKADLMSSKHSTNPDFLTKLLYPTPQTFDQDYKTIQHGEDPYEGDFSDWIGNLGKFCLLMAFL